MIQKFWILLTALMLLGMAALIVHPVTADSQAQAVYQTPTARPDGRVIYVVQANDTCLRIQLLTGTTIDQLRTLNKLDQNCTINPGQELLLAVITPPATATANPLISPTPLLPTPTPLKGNGKICVLLYDDINGNAVHETTEPSLAGGAASISNPTGNFTKTINTTDAVDPICEEVPEGNYNISMAIPSGYNPTKNMNATVTVQAGYQAIFEFGAQVSTNVPQVSGSSGGGGPQPAQENSLPLAILGGVFVVLGIGLGGYILFTRRSPTS